MNKKISLWAIAGVFCLARFVLESIPPSWTNLPYQEGFALSRTFLLAGIFYLAYSMSETVRKLRLAQSMVFVISSIIFLCVMTNNIFNFQQNAAEDDSYYKKKEEMMIGKPDSYAIYGKVGDSYTGPIRKATKADVVADIQSQRADSKMLHQIGVVGPGIIAAILLVLGIVKLGVPTRK